MRCAAAAAVREKELLDLAGGLFSNCARFQAPATVSPQAPAATIRARYGGLGDSWCSAALFGSACFILWGGPALPR